MPSIAGVRLAAAEVGIRYKNRADVLVATLSRGTAAAGVLTRSRTAAAPVDWCRQALRKGRAGALVVNAGNANAFTGGAGIRAVKETATMAAKVFGCAANEVYLASTGIIGEPLDSGKIVAALSGMATRLSDDAWQQAAAAITTTDTFPKGATRAVSIAGERVRINGIAKGSGMIAPDMATMLAFIFTDAAIPGPVLQKILSSANQRTFNAITVDSDTSTSDTALAFATGQVKHKRVRAVADPHLRDFRRAFEDVLLELAHQIVRDGEGASKFVTITVTGAASAGAARTIAFAVANSPLVKTAIAGEDANWGRIVAAVGKAGERAERDKLVIKIGGHVITERGMVRPGYDETPVAAHMRGREVDIEIDVGVGRGRATVWTCDLTHRYIDINGSYRS
jgi:glutamate N-acetyltransferase/amino-acid N-acetyltransferase